jgi:hypothetical protein
MSAVDRIQRLSAFYLGIRIRFGGQMPIHNHDEGTYCQCDQCCCHSRSLDRLIPEFAAVSLNKTAVRCEFPGNSTCLFIDVNLLHDLARASEALSLTSASSRFSQAAYRLE